MDLMYIIFALIAFFGIASVLTAFTATGADATPPGPVSVEVFESIELAHAHAQQMMDLDLVCFIRPLKNGARAVYSYHPLSTAKEA